MARSNSYTYDPKTGTWTMSTTDTGDSGSQSSSTPTTTTDSGKENLTSSTSDSSSSTGSVEKEYNEIEVNTLSGTLNFIVTEETIKLKAGDTVKLLGLGKYLSGNYYVKEVTRQVSNNGYSHSATVIKTDFGKTLKSSTTTTGGTSSKKEETAVTSPATSTTTPKRTHTAEWGDTLWGLAKYYYGNGALYHRIYDANRTILPNPNTLYVGQVLTIP